MATKQIDGVLIKPGEYFSFCRLVGCLTAKKGYLEGMELSFGQARKGIGVAFAKSVILFTGWHFTPSYKSSNVQITVFPPFLTKDEFYHLDREPLFFIILLI